MRVWTQWSDLSAPDGITLLSPDNFPLDSADLSQIDMYVPSYMGGAKALSYAAKMSNLKILQMLNAGYDLSLIHI